MKMEMATLPTPIGTIRLAVRDGALCALGFEEQWPSLAKDLESRLGPVTFVRSSGLEDFVDPLKAYFQGNPSALDRIPVRLDGTPFQQEVWRQLRRIPAGTTVSYAELARRVGKPRAQRAVGAANGANPVSIVVPCHRVVRSDGKLGGYGGGADRKRWLLAHESVMIRAGSR
jgi:methylated-DNA-[protein]-cysteine S-methyltransferase